MYGAVERLTPRMRQVCFRVAQGKETKEIAKELGIAPQTVHNIVVHACKRLGLRNRIQLPVLLLKHGYFTIKEMMETVP